MGLVIGRARGDAHAHARLVGTRRPYDGCGQECNWNSRHAVIPPEVTVITTGCAVTGSLSSWWGSFAQWPFRLTTFGSWGGVISFSAMSSAMPVQARPVVMTVMAARSDCVAQDSARVRLHRRRPERWADGEHDSHDTGDAGGEALQVSLASPIAASLEAGARRGPHDDGWRAPLDPSGASTEGAQRRHSGADNDDGWASW